MKLQGCRKNQQWNWNKLDQSKCLSETTGIVPYIFEWYNRLGGHTTHKYVYQHPKRKGKTTIHYGFRDDEVKAVNQRTCLACDSRIGPGWAKDCPLKNQQLKDLTLAEMGYDHRFPKAKNTLYEATAINQLTMTHKTDGGKTCEAKVSMPVPTTLSD